MGSMQKLLWLRKFIGFMVLYIASHQSPVPFWGINFFLYLNYFIWYKFLFILLWSFYFWIHLILFTFQVLAYILSTVDDTKLLSKVGSSSDVCHELFSIINGVAFYWKFLIKISLSQIIIRELQANLKELALDKVSTLLVLLHYAGI